MTTLLIILIIVAFMYYAVLIGTLLMGDYHYNLTLNTRRDFIKALIPFFFWGKIIYKRWKELPKN